MNKTVLLILILVFVFSLIAFAYIDSETRFWVTKIIGLKNPEIFDANLSITEIAVALPSPYQMALMDNGILFLDKNSREIRFISNGNLADEPINIPIPNKEQLSLRGIASFENDVYLYFIETENMWVTKNNYVYKFEWKNNELVNPILINANYIYTDTPHAGEMLVTPDGSVYVAVGRESSGSKIENLSHHFANYYGLAIHGLEYDPKTGYLWYTQEDVLEKEVSTFVPRNYTAQENLEINRNVPYIDGLPEVIPYNSETIFRWNHGGYPEGIAFVSDKWGDEYANSLIVAGCDRGELYKFDLNSERTGFVFSDPDLVDGSFDKGDSSETFLFGENFWCVTDLEYDSEQGILYVVPNQHNGVIYKITPKIQS